MPTDTHREPSRAELVRELRQKTGAAEKSIYRWLNANGGPINPRLRRIWDRSLATARAKLAKAAP